MVERYFKTVYDLNNSLGEYKKPVTKHGLAVSMGISIRKLEELALNEDFKDYFELVFTEIERSWVDKLQQKSPQGSMFMLERKFDWEAKESEIKPIRVIIEKV
jgi:hypothetical protein